MKILFVNRPEYMWTGGDWFQMKSTATELRKLGVEVDIKESYGYGWSFYSKDYDIIHTFNFTMHWNEWLKEPKYANTKYVCSMIYQPNMKENDFQKRYDNLDAAIFLTEGEQNRLDKDNIKVDKSKHYIIPNGIEEFWFDKPDLLLDSGKRLFVLTVGRLCEHKGQQSVAAACQMLNLPYVSIGGTTNNSKGRLTILPDMEREDLKQFYHDCSVFVLASRDEIMPMTVMEAGAQAKNIILTNGCEWELPHVDKVEFGDIMGIAKAIERSLKKPPNYPLQSMLKKMTWKDTAEQLLTIYKKLCSGKE